MMFELNPNMQVKFETIGRENTRILVVDDFFVDYQLAVEEAISANYSTRKEDVGAFYPGMRAPLRKDYGFPILQFAARAMHQELKLPRNLQVAPINANYSLLTKQPKDMQLEQCIPHFDTSEKNSFAVLHYMNDGEFGGTGFYRHKPTNYENISSEREAPYFRAMQESFKQKGAPKQQYFCDSDEHFELIRKVDYRANRLVAYPTSILHTAYIDNPQRDVIADPKVGRLSSNFLFRFQASQSPNTSGN
jgi:predicted SprT family Zn-dependent metalloprotease